MTSLISCEYIFMWYPQVTVIAGIQQQLNARVGEQIWLLLLPQETSDPHRLLPLSPKQSGSESSLRYMGLTSSPRTFEDMGAET